MLWLNSTADGKREKYCLSAMQNVGTSLINACVGAYHVKHSMNKPPVWLIQSVTEIMQYGLARQSRKENLTEVDISAIVEPVIDVL